MKILMIPSWYPTENMPMLGTFYKEQAEAMAAAGAEVAVIYTDVNKRLAGHTTCFTENGVYTVICQHMNWTPGSEAGRVKQRTAMLFRAYRRLLREWGRPDVVNLRSSLQGYEALALCRRERLPLFFMEHSSVVLTEDAGSPAARRLSDVMAHAAVTACVSRALAAPMQAYGQVRVIPDLVDTDRFTVSPIAGNGTFRFRAMGQLRAIKGYDVLIKAFAELKRRTARHISLEIAGEGVLHGQLVELIESCGVGDCCSLVGVIPRTDTPLFMNGADCFLCTSRNETLSCVLNEAAACGRPVISTRCGGPEDIVTPQTGMLVPVDDVAALASAMEQMLDGASSYDADTIRQLTVSRFGKDAVSRRLLDAAAEAVEKGWIA